MSQNHVEKTEFEQFAHLVEAFAPGARLIRHWPLTGGVSAQTTALEIDRDDGQVERFVVRAHGERDLARDPEIAAHEYQLLHALWNAGLPVPRPVHVHQAGEIFDEAAVVVEFVEGEIISDPESPSKFATVLAYWLARIHEFDLTANDFGFLVANDYLAAERFLPRPDDTPLVRSICQALSYAPEIEFRNRPVLLHGDYWPGNLLWQDGELSAIIDWEDAAIGDPILDLARARVELQWTLGEMARERFTAHYLSYRDIDVDFLAYWDLAMALGFVRALPEWGLPAERQQEMETAIARLVDQATRQLTIDRS